MIIIIKKFLKTQLFSYISYISLSHLVSKDRKSAAENETLFIYVIESQTRLVGENYFGGSQSCIRHRPVNIEKAFGLMTISFT